MIVDISLIVMAYCLDLLLGDPERWIHPVRLMGKAITVLQKALRHMAHSACALKWAGLGLWIIVVGGSYSLTYLIIEISNACFGEGIAYLFTLYLAYTTLATKSLKEAAMRVFTPLQQGNLDTARQQLSYIVGRDTAQLDDQHIIRATVETVAENTVDGVIAPLFYLAIGGAPLAIAYKAVNTLDSMVGHRNEKYQSIGYVSAKMDDVANLIPARLAWIVLSCAAFLLRLDGYRALRIGWRDRYQHLSPNSAWSEATVAGALGIQLGGASYYAGECIHKPFIGDQQRPIRPLNIIDSIQLLYTASLLTLSLFIAIKVMIPII